MADDDHELALDAQAQEVDDFPDLPERAVDQILGLTDRNHAVRVTVHLSYTVPGPLRLRDGKLLPRYRETIERDVDLSFPAEVLDGDDGLQDLCCRLAQKAYEQLRTEGWPRRW